MSDLIFRQDAIDALKEAFNSSLVGTKVAVNAIEILPSAEPTRCQHCKYAMAVKNQIVKEIKSAEPVIRCEEDVN